MEAGRGWAGRRASRMLDEWQGHDVVCVVASYSSALCLLVDARVTSFDGRRRQRGAQRCIAAVKQAMLNLIARQHCTRPEGSGDGGCGGGGGAPARKQYLPKTGRKSGCRWGSEICHVAKGVADKAMGARRPRLQRCRSTCAHACKACGLPCQGWIHKCRDGRGTREVWVSGSVRVVVVCRLSFCNLAPVSEKRHVVT
jgi:hypothetical protein